MEDATIQSLPAGDEVTHVFNPSHSCSTDNPGIQQTPQRDIIVNDNTQSEKQPVPNLSVNKKNEQSSHAWKKNMISLNEDIETGPSQAFQNEAGGSLISSPEVAMGTESTSVDALHNTKLFIPPSLNTPQHSTPLKINDNASLQSGNDPKNVSNVVNTLSQQQEPAIETRQESATSSSAVARLELHQPGSMLTPPGK